MIPRDHDFFNLYNQFLDYDKEITSEKYKDYANLDKVFYILFGLSQKTFWFQEMHRLIGMNARFYELLYEIPKRNNSIPQFYLQIETKYGVGFSTYCMACMALLWISSTGIYYRFPYDIDPKLSEINIDNILLEKMILDYIGDYEDIRKSSLETRQLYLTPIMRTSSNELLDISSSLVARKAATNLYWETRDIYRKNQGKELNQMMGDSFEVYVDELLDYYLPKHMYKRLPKSEKRKQADLVITANDYVVITEQKFSMLNISLQDTVFDLKAADYWLKSYVQAVKQLEETARQIGRTNKIVIKLILFFENLSIADGIIKERVMKLYREEIAEDVKVHNVFMIGIDDYEMLIHLMSCNEDLFNRIIHVKMEREKKKDISKGVEFGQIFQEHGIKVNEYITTKMPLPLE